MPVDRVRRDSMYPAVFDYLAPESLEEMVSE